MTLDWLGALLVVAAVALGFVLEVQLPWRGRVPLGHAAVIALAVLLEASAVTAAVASGLAIALPFLVRRHGKPAAVRRVATHALAAAAAVATNAAVHLLPEVPAAADVRTFLHVVLAGAVYLAVDFRLGAARPTAPSWREALPLHVVLVCAAALLALAHQHYGGLIAPVIAGLPLVVIRFSFERYALARQTYEQTSQALGLLPEVAGITPLGHGARSAVYAERLAAAMGMELPEVASLGVAARLHHIGDVSLHEPSVRPSPVDAAQLAGLSEDILMETGFLADVAPIVAAVRRAGEPAPDRSVAIVRIASSLDDLAGDGAEADLRLEGVVVDLLARHTEGFEREAAIALIALLHRRPGLLGEGRAASAALALAAART